MSKLPTRLTKEEVEKLSAALRRGRVRVITQAFEVGRFLDSRLLGLYLRALKDTNEFGDVTYLASFVAEHILPAFPARIYSEVQKGYKKKGGESNGLRLKVLHRLNPKKTKPLVEDALKAGSSSVKHAAIACLADHLDSFERLLELSQEEEYCVSAEEAISRLGTAQSQAYLLQKLEDDDYHLLFNCNDEKVKSAARKKGAECLAKLQAEKSNAKRRKLREQLVTLVKISESASTKQDRLLLDCLKHVDCFGPGAKNQEWSDFSDIAVLIGLRKKRVAMELIDARDRIPAADFGVVADVGRKYLQPAKFFEIFSPYLQPKAKRKTPEGKRDSELFDSLSRGPSTLWSYDEFQAGREEKAKLDPRWADLAMKNGDDELVCELANLKPPKLSQYLEQALQTNCGKDPFNSFPIIEAMIRSNHPNAAQEYVDLLTKKATRKGFDPDYQRWLYLLKDLPDWVTDEVRKLPRHPRCNEEAAEQIPEWLELPFDEYFTVGIDELD